MKRQWLIFFLAAFPYQLYAAAWTLPQNETSLHTTLSTYGTDSYYDLQGKSQPQTAYRKYELNLYAEYGITDKLTAGTNLSIDTVRGDSGISTIGKAYNTGLSNPSFFGRYRLWKNDTTIFSVQPLIKLPSLYIRNHLPRGGTKQTDLELRLLAGHSFQSWGRYHFANIELAYRHRFDTPEDQLHLDATLGFRITDRWMIMPQLFSTWRTKRSTASSFTQSSADDYDLIKSQLSGIYSLNEKTSLQMGIFHHTAGRNTGSGAGGLLSLWYRL